MSKWISVGAGPVRVGSSIKGPSQSSPMGCGGAAGALLLGLVLLPFLAPWEYTAVVYGTIAVIAMAVYITIQNYRRKAERARERRRVEAKERENRRQLEAASRKQAREEQLQWMKEAAASKKKRRAEQRQAWIEAGKSSVPPQRPKTDKPGTAQHTAASQAMFTDVTKAIRSKLQRTTQAED